MKRREVKEMIKAAFLAEMGSDAQYADEGAYGFYNEAEEDLDEMLARLSEEEIEEGDDKVVDPYLAEAEEEEDVDVKVDVEDLEDEVDVKDTDLSADDEEVKTANDSIVVDKKIVSLSSLPGETRKILDTLETLRAQAEEFGDQKFMTQVGNTITFFTRDFVVAGDQPNPAGIEESLEILKMRKLAGLLTEGEYTKALLREAGGEMQFLPSDPIPGTAELTSDVFDSIKNKLISSGKKLLNKIPKDELKIMKSAAEDIVGPDFGLEDITMDNAKKVGKLLTSRLTEDNLGDKIGGILGVLGLGTAIVGVNVAGVVAIAGLVAMLVGYIIGQTFGSGPYSGTGSSF